MTDKCKEKDSVVKARLAPVPCGLQLLLTWIFKLDKLAVESLVELGDVVCLLVARLQISSAPTELFSADVAWLVGVIFDACCVALD